MALGIAPVIDEKLDYAGTTPFGIFDLTGDNNYPAGGYAVNAALFGLRLLAGLIELANNTAGIGVYLSYNNQTGKIQFLQCPGTAAGPGVEIGGGTNVSAFVYRCAIVGLR